MQRLCTWSWYSSVEPNTLIPSIYVWIVVLYNFGSSSSQTFWCYLTDDGKCCSGINFHLNFCLVNLHGNHHWSGLYISCYTIYGIFHYRLTNLFFHMVHTHWVTITLPWLFGFAITHCCYVFLSCGTDSTLCLNLHSFDACLPLHQ